jgi:hypothetical protein
MFLIFGFRDVKIKKSVDQLAQCTECKSFGIEYSFTQKCFHIFWIPFFPVGGKIFESCCQKCFGTAHKSKLDEIKNRTKTPFWMFTGSIIIAILILWIAIIISESRERERNLVANPRVNDVYLVSDEDENGPIYYFIKLKEMKKDSLFFIGSTHMYLRSPNGMDSSNRFSYLNTHSLLKSDLIRLNEDRVIIRVYRHYGANSVFHKELDSGNHFAPDPGSDSSITH